MKGRAKRIESGNSSISRGEKLDCKERILTDLAVEIFVFAKQVSLFHFHT